MSIVYSSGSVGDDDVYVMTHDVEEEGDVFTYCKIFCPEVRTMVPGSQCTQCQIAHAHHSLTIVPPSGTTLQWHLLVGMGFLSMMGAGRSSS